MSVVGPNGSGLARWRPTIGPRMRWMRRIGLVFAGRNMADATHKVWYPMLAPRPKRPKPTSRHLGRRNLRIPGPLGYAGLLRRLHKAQSGSPVPPRPASSSEPFQQSVSSPVRNPPISRSETEWAWRMDFPVVPFLYRFGIFPRPEWQRFGIPLTGSSCTVER